MTDISRYYVCFFTSPRVWFGEKPTDIMPPGVDFNPIHSFEKEQAAHLSPKDPVATATGDGYEVLFMQDGLIKTRFRAPALGSRGTLPAQHAEYLEYLNAIQLLVHVALLSHAHHQIDIEEITAGHVFRISDSSSGSPSRTTLQTIRWPAWMRPVLPREGIEEVVANLHRVFADNPLRAVLAQLATAASEFYAVNFQAAGTQLHRVIDVLWFLFRNRHPHPGLTKRERRRRQEELWEASYGGPRTLLDGPRNDYLHNNVLQGRGTTPFDDTLCKQGFAMACAATADTFGLAIRVGTGWGWSPWLGDSE